MAGGPEMFLGGNLTTEGAAASAARGSGTSMMPAFALGSYLLGTGLDAYGQYQGAKSMERAAQRQLAEQEAFNAERNALIQTELARRAGSPVGLSQSAGVTTRLGGNLRALRPAARSAGRALGVNAAGVDATMTGLIPAMRVGAHRDASALRAGRDQRAMSQLGLDVGDVSQRGREAASLYESEDELAGMTGQTARVGGGLMRLGGMGGINLLMNQARPGAHQA